MAGYIGRQVVFEVGDVGQSPLEAIPGVREKGISCAGEPIDVTSDEDGGWRLLLEDPAQNEVSISLSGVVKSETLKDRYFNGARTMQCRFTYPGGGVLAGTFFMSSFNQGKPYNDASTFDAELVSTGEVTYTPASP